MASAAGGNVSGSTSAVGIAPNPHVVRLPSIDHGLSGLPNSAMSYRRSSLTDPMLHAHGRNSYSAGSYGNPPSSGSSGLASIPAGAPLDTNPTQFPMHTRLSATFPQVNGVQVGEPVYYGHHVSVPDGTASYFNTGRRFSASSDVVYHPHDQHHYHTGMQQRTSYPLHHAGYIPPPGYNNTLKRKSTGDAEASHQQVRRFMSTAPGQPSHYSDYPPPVVLSESVPPGLNDAQAAAWFSQQERRRASLALSEGTSAAEAASEAAAAARRNSGTRSGGPDGKRTQTNGARRKSLRHPTAPAAASPALDAGVADIEYAFPTGLVKGESPAPDETYPHNAALATYTFGGPPRAEITSTANNTTTSSIPAPSGFPPIPRVSLPPSAADLIATPEVTTAAASLTGLPMPDDTTSVAKSIFGRRTASSEDLDGDVNDHLKPPTRDAPYSRSPELKISHKMAERKRRSEMTGLFDDLRAAMPAERGTKSSKWETLSKAIDYIAKLTEEKDELARTVLQLREKVTSLEQTLQEERMVREQSYLEGPSSAGLYGPGATSAAQSASYMPQHAVPPGGLLQETNRHASPGSLSVHSGIASSYQVSPYTSSMGLPQRSPYDGPEHVSGHTSGSAPPMLPPSNVYGHVRPPLLHHSQSHSSIISASAGSPGTMPMVGPNLSVTSEVSNFRSHQSNPSIHSVQSIQSLRSRAHSHHSHHSHSLSLASDKGLTGSPGLPIPEDFNPFTHVAPAQPVA